jgi:hypothetical protein
MGVGSHKDTGELFGRLRSVLAFFPSLPGRHRKIRESMHVTSGRGLSIGGEARHEQQSASWIRRKRD